MTPKELLAHLAEQKEQIKALKALWAEAYPDLTLPADRVFRVWLNMYGFDTSVYGLTAALPQLSKRTTAVEQGKEGAMPMAADQVVRYASACMRDKKAGKCKTA